MKRIALLAVVGPALLVFSLNAQSLDDYWDPGFGLPGFEGSIVATVDDGAGGFYAVETIDNSVEYGPSLLYAHRHHYDGTSWSSMPIPLDTLELEGMRVVPDLSSGVAIEPGTGHLLGFASTVGDSRSLLLRFDADAHRWSMPSYQISSRGYFPIYGNDGHIYCVLRESVGGELLYRLNRVEGGEWVPVEGVPTGVGNFLRLLGVTSEGIPYVAWTTGVNEDGTRIFIDSLGWPENGEFHRLSLRSDLDSAISHPTIMNGRLYLVSQRWSHDENRNREKYETRVVTPTPSGYLPVTDFLAGGESGYIDGPVWDVAVTADTTIYLAGSGMLARWSRDTWQMVDSFSMGGRFITTTTGELYANRIFSDDLRLYGNTFARLDVKNGTWVSLYSSDREYGGHSVDSRPIVTEPGGFVIAGGAALEGEETITGDLLRFENGVWSAITSGLSERYGVEMEPVIFHLTKHPERGYYAAGRFTPKSGSSPRNIAWYDGESWHPLEETSPFGDRISMARVHGRHLYALGSYTTPDDSLYRSRSVFARWDGERWSTLLDTLNLNSACFYVVGEPGSETIFIGGLFSSADRVSWNRIAMREGGQWSDMNGGAQRQSNYSGYTHVTAFAGTDEELYAGGRYHGMGEAGAVSIARWDGRQWHALDSGIVYARTLANGEMYMEPGEVSSIAENENFVVVGGWFNGAGTLDPRSPRFVDLGSGVAFWEKATGTWNSLGSGLVTPTGDAEWPSTVAIAGDTLWMSGRFRYAGGNPSSGVARFYIPPPYIARPDAPAVLDFGEVRLGDTLLAYLPVTNPSTSTRTVRGDMEEPTGPFGITFDGTFQGASGQTSLLPVTYIPTTRGHHEDTVMVTHNGSGDPVPVILRGNVSTTGVGTPNTSTDRLDLLLTPNPIDEKGQITFTLPRPGRVQITLYSVDGRRLRTIVDREMSAGLQTVGWERGELPPGSFLCQVSWSGGERVARVMVR